ncbi:MAG: hypothetical protein EU529_14860 [Promethearchaeota archaeon]|nr:MAG: hypothetical protein EU529_14860 [Candidatus Lokiarchaeota archaeon]
MSPDKNRNDIEKLLKTLGQKIRIDILKKLKNSELVVSFSKLQKEILDTNQNSLNFSYHIKALEKVGLISSSEDGYFISSLGKKILNIVLSMEQFLDDQNKITMIRTSKYSKEVFDFKKIEDYLIKEGELERYLAKKIAREVKERLSKINIEYLTSPLMREFINAILLEEGLEDVRHKLTRLGTPPYEVFKLFKNNEIFPENFIQILGSDVSEQFLLLNLLPNHLADLYLSGEIALCHLNYWSLRPLSIYVNTETLLDIIFKRYSNISKNVDNSKDLLSLLLSLVDLIYQIKPYFSEDLVLGDFNNKFLSLFNFLSKDKNSDFHKILFSQISRYNKEINDSRSHLSLEFCYDDKNHLNGKKRFQFQNDKLFLEKLNNGINYNENHINPLILFDYSKFDFQEIESFVLNDINLSNLGKNFIFYDNKSHLLNSNIIKIMNSDENKFLRARIILDKILINLNSISSEANQNDDVFCDLLQDKLNSVFEFFSYKESLINRKLNSLKNWEPLVSDFFGEDFRNWSKYSLKSISFIGLNEAIINHCGLELDRVVASQSFALKILSLLKDLINEKNENENESFVLSQPHRDRYIALSKNNKIMKLNKKNHFYSPRIIRKNSKLPLQEKISIFKKFETVIEGGTKFNNSLSSNNMSKEESLKILMESKLKAFSIH